MARKTGKDRNDFFSNVSYVPGKIKSRATMFFSFQNF